MAKTKAIQGELVVDAIAIRSQFRFDENLIATTKQQISAIAVIDRPSFDAAWEIRQDLRGLRVGIDKERKRLTEKARSYTGMVNDVAKSILAHIEPVECEIVTKIARYETAEVERKKAVELARQKALQIRIDALMAVEHVPNSFLLGLLPVEEYATLLAESTNAFEEKKLAHEQERLASELAAKEKADKEAAERDAIEEKRKAERVELERQRKEIEEQQAALTEQRNKLESEARLQREEMHRQRKEIEDKQAESNRIEAERLAAIKRESDRAEAERLAEIERENESARLEAIKPDAEKLRQFSSSLRLIAYPLTDTLEGERMFDRARKDIADIATYCEDFGNAN